MPSSNRLDLDYTAESKRFAPLDVPIIDVHTHINGLEAAKLYRRATELYGIGYTFSMTSNIEEIDAIREVLSGAIEFIAVPNFRAEDRLYEFGPGFLDRIRAFHAAGSQIVKFWSAPRGLDFGEEVGDADLLRLDAPGRIEAMELASSLDMVIMTHIADPDTWFKTKYADASRYGTKAQQYEPLEAMLDRFNGPWIAAHMGGWPEDLTFLTGLLDRHPNLHLDTSATKWMVREVSRQPADALHAFLRRFHGRILFGSDIVTSDEHLESSDAANEMGAKASSPDDAFDLYASRHWALRTMWETTYDGESPISDPDLAMVDPDHFEPDDAPQLVGKSLPPDLLRDLYHDAAAGLLRLPDHLA